MGHCDETGPTDSSPVSSAEFGSDCVFQPRLQTPTRNDPLCGLSSIPHHFPQSRLDCAWQSSWLTRSAVAFPPGVDVSPEEAPPSEKEANPLTGLSPEQLKFVRGKPRDLGQLPAARLLKIVDSLTEPYRIDSAELAEKYKSVHDTPVKASRVALFLNYAVKAGKAKLTSAASGQTRAIYDFSPS